MKKNLLDPDLLTRKIWDGTYVALKSLIESCYYSQLAYSSYLEKNALNPQLAHGKFINGKIGYWKEYCTVRTECSRRSGHTTSIVRVIPEYFHRALILSHNLDQARGLSMAFSRYYGLKEKDIMMRGERIIKRTNDEIETDHSQYVFGSINSLDSFRGCEFEAIVVDCAFMLTPKNITNIYKLGPCMNINAQSFFIFVQ